MAQKTEAPTPRRQRRARSEGDSPVSRALIMAASFVVIVALLPAATRATAAHIAGLLRQALSGSRSSATSVAWDVALLTGPLLLAGALAAVAVGLFQTQGTLAFRVIRMDFGRLDPVRGLSNLLRAERGFAFFLSLLGAALVAGLTVTLIRDQFPSWAGTIGNLAAASAAVGSVGSSLFGLTAVLGLALAAVDVSVRHFAWLRRLRMTREEVRREQKDAEGDPHIKRARRSAHEELLEHTALSAMSNATLLVMAGSRLATALHYEPDTDADDESPPRVTARGRGELATRMRRAAFTHGVPIVEDAGLANALAALAPGAPIPEALYEPVAALLRSLSEQDLWALGESA